MDMRDYEHDHGDIARQTDALQQLIDAGAGQHAQDISDLLARMGTGIKLHLATEERFLYPALEQSGDAEAAELGKRFKAEMNGIYQAFGDYLTQWRVPANIEADHDGFKQNTEELLEALADRIQREESELHAVAKRVPLPAH